ncbi:wobble nucleotide-excising tRNase, partial [Zymomonas mobilis]
MTIERISKIKSHRIFRDFVWPEDLPTFKGKNLFYGWNGMGKSTLSELFRSIEKKSPVLEGDIEFIISGNKVDGKTFATAQGLPSIRVFNKNFVTDNVFTSNDVVTPIFVLGEENIEKQKRVKKLKHDINLNEIESGKKETEKRQSERDLDSFKTHQAKSIKDLLSSSGGNNRYNNYDKRLYQTKCEELLRLSKAEQKAKILNESDFHTQKKKKDSTQLDKLKLLNFSYPDTRKLTEQVVALLKKTVVSTVIESLKNDKDLSEWVKTGLEKHQKEHSCNCLFCGQPLPDGQIEKLEAHFNKEFNTFIAEVKDQITIIESEIEKSYALPNWLSLYDHLKGNFNDLRQEFLDEIERVKEYLENLLAALKDKEQKPFQPIEHSFEIITGNENIIFNLNAIIIQHNQETDEFQTGINTARTKIEESLVAKSLIEYQHKKNEVDIVSSALHAVCDKITELRTEVHKIEEDIEEHRKPADELNADICSYLGRKELTFEIKGSGYQISRNGTPAKNLSEGERTAIAFLYFLKSLEDKSFSLEDGIVVIDDPVSSMDSNALFYAFSIMKKKTENAGQLFILTHSHSFFRQVKNWFNYLPNQKNKDEYKRPGMFYMLTKNVTDSERSSSISRLDSLLCKYESEYHYLFKLVYDAANSEKKADLQQNYHLPNIARRLLETFLAFRQPSMSGKLHMQLKSTNFDDAKKTRILRFLHTY